MKWITRERPKIDRIASPWLILRFVDPKAEFLYVPFDEVLEKSKKLKAIPFDFPDVEYSHYGSECTFDYIIKKHKITDPAVRIIGAIVRGADTDRHDISKEAAGLWAISAGLSENIRNDYDLLKQGLILYDALYTWASRLKNQRHTQGMSERLLIDVYQRLSKVKDSKRRTPAWARQLRELIQDQIDTNLSLGLKELSQSLNVHPSYLSREFSKHFDNLSFGEYIRKLRINKAIDLLRDGRSSLGEIAYLTGFSDQSHFNRIFKQHTGMTPLQFKKQNKR